MVKVKRLSHDPTHALNAICPYYTMFPLEYPMAVLKSYEGRKRVRLLDPFCGRGTSLYAARVKGHAAFGIDSSPVATAIARAKTAVCTADEVMELAQTILKGSKVNSFPRGEFWEWAFSEDTLINVATLRKRLNTKRSDRANVLRALCLGALHGPLTKDRERPSYFSNQMPRTFATKPSYSVRYWKRMKLRPPEIDVLGVIRRRVDRLQLDQLKRPLGNPRIHTGDARYSRSYVGFPDSVHLIITSPAYFGMQTYVEDQWLRNWFLGHDSEVPYGNHEQLCHESPEAFSSSLAQVWNRVGDRLVTNGRIFLRFGSIPSRQQNARVLIRESLNLSQHSWRIIQVRSANSSERGKRQAAQMGMRVTSTAVDEYDFEIGFS